MQQMVDMGSSWCLYSVTWRAGLARSRGHDTGAVVGLYIFGSTR